MCNPCKGVVIGEERPLWRAHGLCRVPVVVSHMIRLIQNPCWASVKLKSSQREPGVLLFHFHQNPRIFNLIMRAIHTKRAWRTEWHKHSHARSERFCVRVRVCIWYVAKQRGIFVGGNIWISKNNADIPFSQKNDFAYLLSLITR